MDWRGVGLAVASALTLGALLLFSERIMAGLAAARRRLAITRSGGPGDR